jgi:hypothetical protein
MLIRWLRELWPSREWIGGGPIQITDESHEIEVVRLMSTPISPHFENLTLPYPLESSS